MKVTVEVSDSEMKEILRYTGEKKKGPAIAKLVADGLMLRRRREMTEEVLSGKWRVELPDWRERRGRERVRSGGRWAR